MNFNVFLLTQITSKLTPSFFTEKMPRSKSGIKRDKVDVGALQKAVEDVLENKIPVRQAAKKYDICRSTLSNHIRIHVSSEHPTFEYNANNDVKKVFSLEQESQLEQYLTQAASLHYGLTKKDARILAFQYARENNIKTPDNWTTNATAGKEWLRHFMNRHPSLSLRKPEATSLARSTSFNKENIQAFFNNLKTVMSRYKFSPANIYNLDETGNSSVHAPPKIIALKGVKQLGSMTSGERGINVTMIAAVNAIGNHVPPMLIFPRVFFKDHMLHGAPPGSIGGANPSGWSNEQLFLQYLQHFIAHVKPTEQEKVLLIFDNHESHIAVPVIDLAKENNIVLLTLPPHTSHRTQPLDRTVFGPYKTYYNTISNEWMMTHPGRPISLYDVAELVGKAFAKAFVPANIVKGFEKTGIWPVNENIFGDHEYLSSYVTDRPNPESEQNPNTVSCSSSLQLSANPSTSNLTLALPLQSNENKANNTDFKSPFVVRPFPKAAARKTSQKGRKRGKTRILTDTPEKEELLQSKMKKPKSVKRKVLCDSSDESNEEMKNLTNDSSDEDLETFLANENKNYSSEQQENEEILNSSKLKEGDFVLVKLASKKNVAHYVAKIVEVLDDEYLVKYLKTVIGNNKFVYSDEEVSCVSEDDIIKKLPSPDLVGTSRRQQNMMSFNVKFDTYNVK